MLSGTKNRKYYRVLFVFFTPVVFTFIYFNISNLGTFSKKLYVPVLERPLEISDIFGSTVLGSQQILAKPQIDTSSLNDEVRQAQELTKKVFDKFFPFLEYKIKIENQLSVAPFRKDKDIELASAKKVVIKCTPSDGDSSKIVYGKKETLHTTARLDDVFNSFGCTIDSLEDSEPFIGGRYDGFLFPGSVGFELRFTNSSLPTAFVLLYFLILSAWVAFLRVVQEGIRIVQDPHYFLV